MKENEIPNAYPDLLVLYRILVTLPIGSTKCDRSFSKLKIVKNCVWLTMGQDRLNSLILLNVEHSMSKSLNFDEIIDVFANTRLRKLLVLCIKMLQYLNSPSCRQSSVLQSSILAAPFSPAFSTSQIS